MKIKKEILVFLLLTAALSAPFYIDFKFSVYLFWPPAIAALLTSRFFYKNVRDFGWRPGKAKYLLIGLSLPVVYGSIIYGALILGGASVINKGFLRWLVKSNAIWTFFASNALYYFSCSLGEEIGWRGFLAPRLVRLTGLIGGGIANGLIWAIWHYPMMFIGKFVGEPNVPLLYCVLSFTLTLAGMGVFLTWLRLKSNSVWPCVLFHASHNLFIKSFFMPLTKPSGITAYISGQFGVAFVALGLIFLLTVKMLNLAERQQCQK